MSTNIATVEQDGKIWTSLGEAIGGNAWFCKETGEYGANVALLPEHLDVDLTAAEMDQAITGSQDAFERRALSDLAQKFGLEHKVVDRSLDAPVVWFTGTPNAIRDFLAETFQDPTLLTLGLEG